MYVSVCVVLGVRVVDRPANSGAGRSRGHAAVRSRARGGGHGRAAGQRPDNMIHSIVDHTNSYAQEKIFRGLHSSYTISDGSLQDVTADEI